jgi:adenylyltransferase/sulfurtransferase
MELQLGDMELTNLERERYKKHLQLDAIGEEGQKKLKRASVLVVGAGGLGSPVLMYLAAAGIGKITIVDGDRVSLSNLQRQVIHTTPMIDALKVKSARERLRLMNPDVNITDFPERLDTANVARMVSAHQVVVDCTDNIETRLLLNETCARMGLPFVFGAVFEFEGQVSVFDASRGPCLRCMLPEKLDPGTIPNPELHGLLGTVPGVIGILQATEVIKLVLGLGDSLIGILLLFDALSASFSKINLKKRHDCPVCGTG